MVLPRPPPQLPLPARCRVFPEAATGSRREQLRCSAILCLPLLVLHPSAAAAELTVSPGRSGALLSRRRPASALRAESAAAAGRGARRRLSRDGPGHFCPVRDWRWRGGLPCARLGWRVGSRGGGELRVVRPREELGVFPEGCNDRPGGGVARRKPRRGVPALQKGLEVAPRTLRVRLGTNLLLGEAPQTRRESLQHRRTPSPRPRHKVQQDVRGVEPSPGPGRTGWARPNSARGGSGRGRQ